MKFSQTCDWPLVVSQFPRYLDSFPPDVKEYISLHTNEIVIDEWKIGVESNTRIEISMPNDSYSPFIRMKGLAIKSESALSTGYCSHDEPQQMVRQPALPFKTVYISFPTSSVARGLSTPREFSLQLPR